MRYFRVLISLLFLIYCHAAGAIDFPTETQGIEWREQLIDSNPEISGAAARALAPHIGVHARSFYRHYYGDDIFSSNQFGTMTRWVDLRGIHHAVPTYPILHILLMQISRSSTSLTNREAALAALRSGLAGVGNVVRLLAPYYLSMSAHIRPLLLEHMDDPGALDALLQEIENTNPHLRSDFIPLLAEFHEDPRVIAFLTEQWNHTKEGGDRNVEDRIKIILALAGISPNAVSVEADLALSSLSSGKNLSLARVTTELFRIAISGSVVKSTPLNVARAGAWELIPRLLNQPDIRRTFFEELQKTGSNSSWTGRPQRNSDENTLSLGILNHSFPFLTAGFLRSSDPIPQREITALLKFLRMPYAAGSQFEKFHDRAVECAFAALSGDLTGVSTREVNALLGWVTMSIERYHRLVEAERVPEVTHFRAGQPDALSENKIEFRDGMRRVMDHFDSFHGVTVNALGESELDQMALLENVERLIHIPEALRELTFPRGFAQALDRLTSIEHPTFRFIARFERFFNEFSGGLESSYKLNTFGHVINTLKAPLTRIIGQGNVMPNIALSLVPLTRKQRIALAKELNSRAEQYTALWQRYNDQAIFRDLQRRPVPQQVRIADGVTESPESDRSRVRVASETDTPVSQAAASMDADLDETCLTTSLRKTAAGNGQGR